MLRLRRGKQAKWTEKVFVQFSESQIKRAVLTKRWKYSVRSPKQEGAHQPSASMYEEEFLYDLECDPYALTNVIGLKSRRTVAETMRNRLIRRMIAAEKKPVIKTAPERPSGGRGVIAQEARL